MKRVSLEEEVRWKIESFNVILHRTIIGVGLGDGVGVEVGVTTGIVPTVVPDKASEPQRLG